MAEFMATIVGFIPMIKLGAVFLFAMFLLGGGFYYVMIVMRRRKWKIEIHEEKADGRLHTVGYDTLMEKKLRWGTKTVYWLKKAKTEIIPPPPDTVDRYRGKEEVDYIRIERDMIPIKKTAKVDYNNPIIRSRITIAYDRIINTIRRTKNHEEVKHRWLYIPIHKTLTASVTYEPIDYDMNMMAMNEIHNADEFFQGKYEFWKKYGAVIVFGLTIIFLIVLIVLTFDWISTIIDKGLSATQNLAGPLNNIADKLGTPKPPN